MDNGAGCITGDNLAIKAGHGTSSLMEVLMGKSAANGGFPMAMSCLITKGKTHRILMLGGSD